MTTTTLRRRAGQRISAALWGLLVIGAGSLMIAALSGYEVDIQLAFIVLLAAVGGWMLLSAAVSGIGRQKEVARATTPTVEEPASTESAPHPSNEATDAHADSPGDAHEAPHAQTPGRA